jgi:ABC-type transporter Mla maintaining outer membrane lipid asymmetry ATPase subunit MlaF
MEQIADKVALIKEGKLIWVDTLENTMASEDSYVKLFLKGHV